jgi:hypothetical protein
VTLLVGLRVRTMAGSGPSGASRPDDGSGAGTSRRMSARRLHPRAGPDATRCLEKSPASGPNRRGIAFA